MWTAVVIATFALGAWVLFLPLGLADSSHLPVCTCGDQALQVWFLAADHYAVVHSNFSLLSTRLDYPHGVNLMDNTSMLLLGALATPLFSAVGPVGVFVLLLRVGILVSATSCFLVLRRYVRSVLAAAVGAALYGFGPFLSHQAEIHLFLTFVPIPPILFLLVQRHLFVGRRRIGVGVALGLLAVAQYFIASEVLVATVLLSALTVTILGVCEVIRRQEAWPRVRGAAATLLVTVAVGAGLLAYPAWFALKGPQHILGRTQPPVRGIDLVDIVRAGSRQLLAAQWLGFIIKTSYQQGDMAFLGIPLLIILIIVVIVERRSRLVRYAAVFGMSAWVLALGPHLIVDGHKTKIALPFEVLDRLPVLQDLIPGRMMLYADLAAAVILAVGVDRLVRLPATLRNHGVRAPRIWLGPLAATAVGLAGLVFVLPVTGYPDVSIGAARSFLDGRASTHIPANGVALAYPYPANPEARAMIWQAESGLRFSLLGGYALRPVHRALYDKQPAVLSPGAVIDTLLGAWPARLPGSAPASPARARAMLPMFVHRYHVTTLLVDLAGNRPHRVIDLFRDVYGRPLRLGRLLIWDDLRSPRRYGPPPPRHRAIEVRARM
jgi:hypothetical protein